MKLKRGSIALFQLSRRNIQTLKSSSPDYPGLGEGKAGCRCCGSNYRISAGREWNRRMSCRMCLNAGWIFVSGRTSGYYGATAESMPVWRENLCVSLYAIVYITILNADIFKERGSRCRKMGCGLMKSSSRRCRNSLSTGTETVKSMSMESDSELWLEPVKRGAWCIATAGVFLITMSPFAPLPVQILCPACRTHWLEHKYNCALPNAGGLELRARSGYVYQRKRPLAASFQGQWAIISLKKRNQKIDNKDPEAVRQNWKKLSFAAAVTPSVNPGKSLPLLPESGIGWCSDRMMPIKNRCV